MVSVPVRGVLSSGTSITNGSASKEPICHPSEETEAIILFVIASLGGFANLLLMILVIVKKPLKKYRQSWSQGLLVHQGLVDLGRSLLLIPLGISVLMCQRLSRCSFIDTAFLLLVTVSTVNMLTSLINEAPIFPEHEQLGYLTAQMSSSAKRDRLWLDSGVPIDGNNIPDNSDSPYCIVFGLFIIWFASLTINLGPTFLSGAMLSSMDSVGHFDVCPMVYKPVRHYVLNFLWISVNLLCVALMAWHLRKLYKDIIKSNLEAVRVASLVTTLMTVQSDSDQHEQRQFYNYIQGLEREGLSRIKMFVIILIAYLLFWGPLYTITLTQPGLEISLIYEISLHVAFVHCFVNPTLFLILYKDLRKSSGNGNNENQSCCGSLCCWKSSHENTQRSFCNATSSPTDMSGIVPFVPIGNPFHGASSSKYSGNNRM